MTMHRVKNEPLRSILGSALTGSFAPVGSITENSAHMVKIKNGIDGDVTISYDGINDHDIILAGDRDVEDLNTNRSAAASAFVRAAGTQFFAKGSATTGSLSVIVIFSD